MNKTRILVTGGAGYIGSALVGKLLNAKCSVTVLDSLLYGGESLLGYISYPKFRFVKGDIRNIDAVTQALVDVHTVVHLAAIVGDPLCKKNPTESIAVNQAAIKSLLDWCRQADVSHFVFASTCSNYGKADGVLDETAHLNPLGVYANTKVEAEKYVLDNQHDGFTVTVLRFATAYGLSPRTRLDVMLNEFALKAFLSDKLELYNPDAWRPFAHVSDIANGVQLCIANPGLFAGQIINVGGHNVTKQGLADTLQENLPNLKITYIGTGKDERDYQVSFAKIARFGFEPVFMPCDGLQEMLQALKFGLFRNPLERKWYNVAPD